MAIPVGRPLCSAAGPSARTALPRRVPAARPFTTPLGNSPAERQVKAYLWRPKIDWLPKLPGQGSAGKRLRPVWDDMWRDLVDRGFESTPPEAAQELVATGNWVLVDVRPAAKFESSHPEGAINVELFRKPNFSKPDLKRYLRAGAMMANGVEPIEPNENFVEDLKAAAGGKGVILACEIGGTLIPSVNFQTGKISRSLKAVYQMIEAGYPQDKVAHLKRGIYGWHLAGLPFTGEYNDADIGRTPSVVEETIFSYGRDVHVIEPTDMDPTPEAAAAAADGASSAA